MQISYFEIKSRESWTNRRRFSQSSANFSRSNLIFLNSWVTDNQCECYGVCNSFLCKFLCEAYCCKSSSSLSPTNTSRHNPFPYISQNADVCAKKNKFDRKASSTYQSDGREFSITYPKGTVSGMFIA